MADGRPQHIGDGLAELLAAADKARREIFGDVDICEPPCAEDSGCRACEHRRARAAAQLEMERRQRVAERAGWLRARGVPERVATLVATAALADPHVLAETKSLRAAQRWLLQRLGEQQGGDPARRVVVMHGPKDASKTTAAGWLVDKWPSTWGRSETTPLMISIEDLHGIWLAYDTPHAETGLRRRDLFSCSLLVIDDAGQEPSHPDIVRIVCEALDTIIRKRCDAGLAVLITTNEETEAAFLARYASRPRIKERLTEYGRFAFCPLEGFRSKDRREEVLRERAEKQRAKQTKGGA